MASPDTTNSTLNLLRRLTDQGVDFVVVGGVAASVHGSVRATFDLDVCAPLDHATCVKIINAVSDRHPKFRSRIFPLSRLRTRIFVAEKPVPAQ